MNQSRFIAAAFLCALAIAQPTPRFAIAQDPERASQEISEKGNPGTSPRISNAKPRTWTDASGKYKLNAALVRVENDKAVLARDDHQEITVPLAKLGDADRQYVAGVAAGNTSAETTPEDSSSQSVDQDSLPGAVTEYETDYRLAPEVDLESIGTWKYVPQVAETSDKLAPVSVILSLGGVSTPRAKSIFLLPNEKLAFVVFPQATWGAGDEATSTMLVCDFSKGIVVADITGVDEAPIAISPDGRLLLSRTNGSGAGRQSELRIYRRDKLKFSRIASWRPYDGNTWVGDADVTWATFTDSGHVLTGNPAGIVVHWRVPNLQPEYAIKARRGMVPAVTADRQHIVVASDKGIALVSLAKGEAVGLISADVESSRHCFAFSDDGQKLATWESGGVRVWDLRQGRLIRDFGLQEVGGQEGVAWAGDNHLVLNGRYVVDVNMRVVVWDYTNVGDAYAVHQGQLWFVSKAMSDSALLLAGTWIPNQQALDAVAKYRPDDLLLLHPGMEVSIDLQGGGSEDTEKARGALQDQLQRNGMAVVSSSKLQLVGRIEQGESQTIRVRDLRVSTIEAGKQPPLGGDHAVRSDPTVSEHQASETKVTLSFVSDGKELWKYSSSTWLPYQIELKPDESIDQAIARLTHRDARSFIGVKLPRYFARLPEDVK